MINKDSIVTAYDEHLTLVEWLQKVETTLKDASAVSFKVNKSGNSTLTFSVVFADGSELETGPITLEQGESVQGASIRNGHLILTLTNGDELNAGDLGGVSGFSIDASQHLIVTYQSGRTQDLGAIFNGNVDINGALSTPILTSTNEHIEAQKPVVEVMTGYSFTPYVAANLSIKTIYAGACKNGNKLTFVLFVKLTRSDALTNPMPTLGQFRIPSAIGAKLYTFTVGNYTALDIRKIFATHNVLENNKEIISYIAKNDNTTIDFRLAYGQADLLPLNTDYYFRYEATFLLSDNLSLGVNDEK